MLFQIPVFQLRLWAFSLPVFTPSQAGWVFSCVDEGRNAIFWSHLFYYLRISSGVTWKTLQQATTKGWVVKEKTSCRGGASFSQASCHTPTLSAGWRPDSRRLITDLKTSPTVYLIKSILTAAQLPSAVNGNSLRTFLRNIKVKVSNFPWATGVCVGLLLPSHFTHKERNRNQVKLNSCSFWAFLHGQECAVACKPTRAHSSPSADF